MENQKQKIYTLLAIGISLFLISLLIIIPTIFQIDQKEEIEVKDIVIANITTQSSDIFWKGYTDDDNFRVLYKVSESTGVYSEIIPTQIYPDTNYTEGYMYLVNFKELRPNTRYDIEIWSDSTKVATSEFNTSSISDEISPPNPISNTTSAFNWVKISDSTKSYIVRTDISGSWSLDSNLLEDDYEVDIYSTFISNSKEVLSKYLSNTVYASELANCDEITYGGIPADIKAKAPALQNILATQQGGGGGSPQYLRCYQDVYCEAEKAGMNPQWTLSDWMHESNASDYNYPQTTLYEDFGVHCCGVPTQNFQAQLGFFLSLSHDPCGCIGGGCTKEQYYCCWGNNYLYGTKSKTCTSGTTAYINSFLTYYNAVGAYSASFPDGLPMPLKGTGKSISCGAQDPIEIYQKIVNGEYEEPTEEDGICCALKLSSKDSFQGDFEPVSSKDCDEIWKGERVYGSTVTYALELDIEDRNSCEKEWGGVCCDVDGEYQWLPSDLCDNKEEELITYNSCIRENGETINLNLTLKEGYNFVSLMVENRSNPLMASDLLNNSSVLLVAGFHNGVWDQIMYKEEGSTNGSDFQLKAGQAYLITSTEDSQVSLSGIKVTTFDWGTLKGWQLVPVEAVKPYNTTKDVVLTFDTVNISQVAIWGTDLGRFKYFIYDVTGEEYGESQRLESNQGVFVKID